jgi:hypothetical protein
MSDRLYNKLYVNKNRDEGSEKLLLGYLHDGKELILKNDQETYFHVPFYTKPILLKDSTLIIEGATPGLFPAASDRIFKNRKDYGNVTANGNPSDLADGTWFCSWLQKTPEGTVRWMDRLYNPGSFKYSIAISQLTEGPVYEINNPIFRDVPSQMILEPGVMYRYYHAGETTAQDLVNTFGGINGQHLLLNINEWGTDNPNTSTTQASSVQPVVVSTAPQSELYFTSENKDRVPGSVISFDNTYATQAEVEYSASYCPTNEFTLSFWAKSSVWENSQTTQLVGNFSSNGGYGLFVQNLSSYPFFIIPETTYGHILYLNESFSGYLDSLHPQFKSLGNLICIDFDHNVVSCNASTSKRIYKFDNNGKIIANATVDGLELFGFDTNETPYDLFCGPDDTIIARTNHNLYTFDSRLVLQTSLVLSTSVSAVPAYRYDISTDFYELTINEEVFDTKFIGTTQFILSATDGNLYKKTANQSPILFHKFSDVATKIAIDPYNRLWILHGTNNLTILNSSGDPLSNPILQTDVGLNVTHDVKNINFFCTYERATLKREWKCIIYYPDEKLLYVYGLTGELTNTVNLNELFDPVILNNKDLNQDPEAFQFLSKGDFTGYENRRIFGKLSPYNNEQQLVLRTSLKDRLRDDLTFIQFKSQTSISNWDKDSWQHFVITLRNKTFTVYINGQRTLELNHSGRYELSYDLQPSLFIGTPNGSRTGFNEEIQYVSSIFNGLIQDIKIYNYALDPNQLDAFIRASIPAEDIYWTLPVPNIQYIEEIDRVFKNKIPGAKSTFYRIKLRGTLIQDIKTREIIEDHIKELASQIQPAYANFLEVHWVD